MPELLGPRAAVDLEVQLARRVGVAVDREQAAQLDGQLQQLGRRIPALRARVDLDGGAGLRAGPEDLLGVELRLPRVPRLPVTSRPVQWPSTLTSGLRTAATIRRVIGALSMASLECTEATRTSSWSSISSVWSSEPSSRMSTSMPLSSRKPPLPPRCSLTASTTLELLGSAARPDRPLATLSRGEWSVSTR